MTRWPIAHRLCFFIISAALILNFLPSGSAAAGSKPGIPRITIDDLKDKINKGEKIVILDVRSGEDYSASPSKITGAVRIPLDQLKDRHKELPMDKEIIAYCA